MRIPIPMHIPEVNTFDHYTSHLDLQSCAPKFDNIILVTVEMKCKSDLQNGEKRTTLLHSISAKMRFPTIKG